VNWFQREDQKLHRVPLSRNFYPFAALRPDHAELVGTDPPAFTAPQWSYSRNIVDAGAIGRTVQVAAANQFASNLLPIIRSIQSAGPMGMVTITKQLNESGIRQHAADSGMCHR